MPWFPRAVEAPLPQWRPRVWEFLRPDPCQVQALAERLAVPRPLAQVLVNRGLVSPKEAGAFLFPELDSLTDALSLPDMEAAARRLAAAAAGGERVCIYGDFDVDGMAATALLVDFLAGMNVEVDYYIPNRFEEGYGLNAEAVEAVARRGITLLVTVDTGITAYEECRQANALGLEVIITDHHRLPEQLPPALAVVNPQRAPVGHPARELAGVGVALKLVQAVEAILEAEAERRPGGPGPGDGTARWRGYLDLAALGTIADVVPLRGENRILAAFGLKSLAAAPRPGIEALMSVAGIKDGPTPGHVGFQLAPRLNAAGRMGDASRGVRLLLSRDRGEALNLARELDRENRLRQETEGRILAEVRQEMDPPPDLAMEPAVVMGSPDWHPGVVGIVAARVAEEFRRPAFLMCHEGEEARGSARSFGEIDLMAILQDTRSLLTRFGGHAGAAGFSLPVRRVAEFKEQVRRFLSTLELGPGTMPRLTVDAVLEPGEVTEELAQCLERLQPFGSGNPEPLFSLEGRLLSAKTVGKAGDHLKFRVRGGSAAATFDAIGFRMGGCLPVINNWREVNMACRPAINSWNGSRSLQLQVEDLSPGRQEKKARLIQALEDLDRHFRVMYPGRQGLAALYLGMKKVGLESPLLEPDDRLLETLQSACKAAILPGTLATGFRVFSEVGLLVPLRRGGKRVYLLNQPDGEKVRLEDSPTYRRGSRLKEELARLQAGVSCLTGDQLEEEIARLAAWPG